MVAFGAATFKKALRGWSGVPGKRMCYRLQKRMPVVLVDECMTSQISNVTLEKLEDVHTWKPVKNESGVNTGEYKLENCWHLKQYNRRCSNGTAGRTFRGLAERNRNAAANIRDILAYWLVHHDRPSQFKRSTYEEEKKHNNKNNKKKKGRAATTTTTTANPTKRILGQRPQVAAATAAAPSNNASTSNSTT